MIVGINKKFFLTTQSYKCLLDQINFAIGENIHFKHSPHILGGSRGHVTNIGEIIYQTLLKIKSVVRLLERRYIRAQDMSLRHCIRY